MPQNALLHFPLVDLVCLRQTVHEHTQRVVKLIHEYNDYLSKCKVFSTSGKVRPTPFPLFLAEYSDPSEVSLSVNDIFGVASGSQLIQNYRAVSRDIVHGQSDSVINRVRSSESNNFHKELTSGSKCRGNSVEDTGNLTSLSCPERFPPSEDKKNFPVPGFETFIAPPKALSSTKHSEFVCESGNDVQKLKSFSSSGIENVKMEHNDIKMEQFSGFEGEDEVMVIEVKKEKNIEVITIDGGEEEQIDSMSPLENSVVQAPTISQPTKSVVDVNPTIPRDSWEVPPYLTPEISQPPCLSPEIMEPIFTPESSQPPLIFPEMVPPMWSFSVPSPMIYSEDAQPPTLSPEVKDIGLAPDTDTSPLLSQPPLMSDALPPMSNTSDPLSLDLPTSTLVSREGDSTQVSEFVMASHQDSTSFKSSSEQSIHSENSTNHITSLQQSEFQFDYSEDVDLDDPFMITPKKTNDITKIKGWKTKQFTMEKRNTVKFHSSNKKVEAKARKGRPNSMEQMQVVEVNNGKESTENAFVSDKLDKFLEGEADLNVNYEIPYLYAELGITLTKDAVMSRPTMSEEVVKMFEKKYQMDIDLKDDNKGKFSRKKGSKKSLTSEQKEKRGVKRKLTQCYRPSKTKKLVTNKKSMKSKRVESGQTLNHSQKSNQTRVTNQGITSCSFEAKDCNSEAFKGHGSTKLLGLALYPGPNAPLPKVVQHYLNDMRSYRNKIDRNWANFALSALVVPKRCTYGRMILPIQYAGETSGMKKSTSQQSTNEVKDSPPETHTEVNKVVTKMVDAVSKESPKQSSEVRARNKSVLKSQRPARLEEPERIRRKRPRIDEKTDKKGTNVKECKILVNKVRQPSRVWCMEHNRYNCRPCGLGRGVQGAKKNESTEGIAPPEFFMSTPLISDRDVSSYLTQKLRHTRWKDVVVSNIDNLRVTVPNALEFIKLKLVKESFLKQHIYIWYLKPHPNLRTKSRAFLTFSETSPVPYAVRLRPYTDKLEEMVPKVVKDLITIKEEKVDIQYVILHCNGKVWEIHGSLRCAADKSTPDKFEKDRLKQEEVFTPVYPPELETISETATKIIKEPAVRWWVLDLSQKFTSIVSKLDTKIKAMTKKSILYGLRTKFYGFLTLNKTSNRVIWIHIFPKMLPYVLIGPYKLSEPHGLVLKQGLKPIPFSYYSHVLKIPHAPLKKFINSVIAQVKEQKRELRGLWLCDRQQVDRTCYLEVISKSSKENIFSMAEYDVDVEHGYSLMSRINRDKRRVAQNPPNVKVYLYFDLFELGYVAGYLQDKTVVTKDPIKDKPVTIPLSSFGKWFLRLIKERISFLPSDINLKCYITKQLEDLNERMPFDAKYLEGHYMICEVGPCSMLKLVSLSTSFSPEDLKAGKAHLKRLEYILYESMKGTTDADTILSQAELHIQELERLIEKEDGFFKQVLTVELISVLVHLLSTLKCDVALKIMLFEWMRDLYKKNLRTDIHKYCSGLLKHYQYGRLYLILKEARDAIDAEKKATAAGESRQVEKLQRKKQKRNRGKKSIELSSVDEVSITSGERRGEHSVAGTTAEEMSSETATISIVETLDETAVETSEGTSTISCLQTSEILIVDPSTYTVTNDGAEDENVEGDNHSSPSIRFIEIEAEEQIEANSSTLSIDPGDSSMVNFSNVIITEDEMPNVETTFRLSQSDYVITFNEQEYSVIMVQDLVCDLSLPQEPEVSVVEDTSEDNVEVITIEEPDSSEMETSTQNLISAPNEEGWTDDSEPVYEEAEVVPTEINATSTGEHDEDEDSSDDSDIVPTLSVQYDLVDELYNHPIVSKLL